MECALDQTEQVERLEFRSGLKFINNLRYSSIATESTLIALPKMDLYRPTSNPMVNQVMKSAYVAFWKRLRHNIDCGRYATWLNRKSKGVALAFGRPLCKTGQRRGITEASLLKPIFKGDFMSNLYSECLSFKHFDAIKCLKVVIKEHVHDPVEREMSLTALEFLDIAANVPASNRDLKLLRSADNQALECIRDWDRIYFIPKIIYLSLLLHARHIIAHLVNNQEEEDKMSKIKVQLNQLIFTEFPLNMIREIGREQIVAGGTATCLEDEKHIVRAVKEIRMLLVRQSPSDDNSQSLFMDDDCVLYIGMNEGSYGNDYRFCMSVLDSIKQDAINGKLTMPTNPTLFKFEFKDK